MDFVRFCNHTAHNIYLQNNGIFNNTINFLLIITFQIYLSEIERKSYLLFFIGTIKTQE